MRPVTGPADRRTGRASCSSAAGVGMRLDDQRAVRIPSRPCIRCSSRSGSPPMPMLPSISRMVGQRPAPGTRSNTLRSSAGRYRAIGSARPPSRRCPRPARRAPLRASAETNRPGPQPTSSVGPVQRSSTVASTSSTGGQPARSRRARRPGRLGIAARAVRPGPARPRRAAARRACIRPPRPASTVAQRPARTRCRGASAGDRRAQPRRCRRR